MQNNFAFFRAHVSDSLPFDGGRQLPQYSIFKLLHVAAENRNCLFCASNPFKRYFYLCVRGRGFLQLGMNDLYDDAYQRWAIPQAQV